MGRLDDGGGGVQGTSVDCNVADGRRDERDSGC